MARSLVAGPEGAQRGFFLGADRLRERAPGAETAASRWGNRRRELALDGRGVVQSGDFGVRDRDRVDQPLGVGVGGMRVHLCSRADLDKLAQVHDPDSVGQVLQDRQVVRDHDQGQVVALLQRADEVEDLGLNRHVESRNGLIGNYELGVEHKSAGQANALALAT